MSSRCLGLSRSAAAALAVALFALPRSAGAGGVSGVKVVAITLSPADTNAFVTLSAELVGGPTCPGPLLANQVAFDHTTAQGKSILSLVTTAHLSAKSVDVSGNDACVSAKAGAFVEGLGSVTLN